MPRTTEHIVETHRHARALRAAGKPIWTHRIDIKSILHEPYENETPSIAEISGKATRIAAKLRQDLPATFFNVSHPDYDFNFNEIVEDYEEYTTESLQSLETNEGLSVLDMFNGRLDELYDWADRNRVWLG